MAPAPLVLASGLQRPVADLMGQTEFFGQGKDLVGRRPLSAGFMPTKQGLYAHGLQSSRIELRLTVQHKLRLTGGAA